MNKIPVVLKMMKSSVDAFRCLSFWQEVFKDQRYELIYLVDNPGVIDKLKKDGESRVLVTPEETRQFFRGQVRVTGNFPNVAAAHFATFQIAEGYASELFWNIDADDSIFFDTPHKVLRGLRKVEAFMNEHPEVHGASHDVYYSLLPKHWSFGISLFRKGLSLYLKTLTSQTLEQIQSTLKVRGMDPGVVTIDQYFDNARHEKELNLKAYIFRNTYFSHYNPGMPVFYNNVYKWTDEHVWERELDEEVIRFDLF
jgi:hypothetical protein